MAIAGAMAIAIGVAHAVAVAHANTDHPEKIRKEYRGSATPNHIVFGVALLSIRGTKAKYPEIAVKIVKQHMNLDSEEAAEAFLSKMLSAAEELDTEWAKVEDEMLCGQDAPRSKDVMYRTLDEVDDLREARSHNVYTKFLSDLDESQQAAMIAWLEERKEGFYYRTAEHESLYENTDYDVIGHVDMVCSERGDER